MAGDHSVPPLGFRFRPTEQELLNVYLLNKVLGFPSNTVTIPMCDLYGDTNPWDLWKTLKESETFNGGEAYVFTLLKKKTTNSSRVNRSVGLGCWSGEDAPKAVYAVENPRLKIGSKKRFRFEKSGTEHDGGWIMIEYSLDKSWLEKAAVNVNQCDNVVTDWVICKVKKNPRRESKSQSVSSLDTSEENRGKKRKLPGWQHADEAVVSEKNKRLRDSRGESDNYQSVPVGDYYHDQSKGHECMVNYPFSLFLQNIIGSEDYYRNHSEQSITMVESNIDQIKGNMCMVNDPLSSGDDDFIQSIEKSLLTESIALDDHSHSEQSVTMVESDIDQSKGNQFMVNDPLNSGDDDFIQSIEKSLLTESIELDDHSHSEQSVTMVESDIDQSKGNLCMVNDPLSSGDDDFIQSIEKSLLTESIELDDLSHSEQSFTMVESDIDQSKGNQFMVNDPLNSGDDDFIQSREKSLLTDDGRSENEEAIVGEQSQQWDDSNMCFDLDWVYKNHPELAPDMDELCNQDPQTAAADEVFLVPRM